MLYKVSAPGSLMLLGEYAVLHRKIALVGAINKRMTVTLQPRKDRRIIIQSALGTFETTVKTLTIQKPFQFILAVLKQHQKKLLTGCDIQIDSEFSDKMGLGSSAAVTVAALMAISAWVLRQPLSDKQCVKKARDVIRSVQGVGSGADVAASVMGGMVAYRTFPLSLEKLPQLHPIRVIYSGSKTPTALAIQKVNQYFAACPDIYKQLIHSVGVIAKKGIAAAREGNWQMMGKMMTIQQGLMESLTVSTPAIRHLLAELEQQSNILGAKISGAGLGDCIIALGNFSTTDIQLSPQGARYE